MDTETRRALYKSIKNSVVGISSNCLQLMQLSDINLTKVDITCDTNNGKVSFLVDTESKKAIVFNAEFDGSVIYKDNIVYLYSTNEFTEITTYTNIEVGTVTSFDIAISNKPESEYKFNFKKGYSISTKDEYLEYLDVINNSNKISAKDDELLIEYDLNYSDSNATATISIANGIIDIQSEEINLDGANSKINLDIPSNFTKDINMNESSLILNNSDIKVNNNDEEIIAINNSEKKLNVNLNDATVKTINGLNINSEVEVTRSIIINDNLTVNKNSTLSGTVDLGTETSNTNVLGALNISGITAVNNNLNVSGESNLSGTVNLGSSENLTNVIGNLKVAGNTELNTSTVKTLTATGIETNSATIKNNLNVSGDTTLDTTNVNGTANLNQIVNLGSKENNYSTNVKGELNINGITTFNAPLKYKIGASNIEFLKEGTNGGVILGSSDKKIEAIFVNTLTYDNMALNPSGAPLPISAGGTGAINSTDALKNLGFTVSAEALNKHLPNTENPHKVTKTQVGLGNVENTGDSAVPVSGGTTKFTTGGAYTELAKKAPNNHANKESTYGLGTTELYGHVKISNGNVDNVASASGLAAGMDHTHTTSISKSTATSNISLDYAGKYALKAGGTNYIFTMPSFPVAASDTLGGVKTSTGITNTSGTISVTYGSAAGTACEGNDSRLSDSRNPKSHTHGNITNDGKLGTASMVVVTDSSKNITTSANVNTTELGYLNGVTSSIQTQLDGKAPTNHASNSSTYGLGTTSTYGHVKISNGDVDNTSSANGLVAGMDHSHSSYLPKSGGIISGEITIDDKIRINDGGVYFNHSDFGSYYSILSQGPGQLNINNNDDLGTYICGAAVTLSPSKYYTNIERLRTLSLPTSSGSSDYGRGSAGQFLRTNGSTVYWGDFSGAVSTIKDSNLTANRVLISNGSGKVATSSNITSTELGYLDGVTSNIQTQLNRKSSKLYIHICNASVSATDNDADAQDIYFSFIDSNSNGYDALDINNMYYEKLRGLTGKYLEYNSDGNLVAECPCAITVSREKGYYYSVVFYAHIGTGSNYEAIRIYDNYQASDEQNSFHCYTYEL